MEGLGASWQRGPCSQLGAGQWGPVSSTTIKEPRALLVSPRNKSWALGWCWCGRPWSPVPSCCAEGTGLPWATLRPRAGGCWWPFLATAVPSSRAGALGMGQKSPTAPSLEK